MSNSPVDLSDEQLESLNNEIKEVVDELVVENEPPQSWWKKLLNYLFGARNKR